MAESSTSADSMEIGFCVFGKVEIDDDVDCLNVYSAGEEVCADEVTTDALTEIVKDAVSVGLQHFGVGIET
jgi:hypothetical protein